MSTPLLYNIEKLNSTVTIQCSVSMYTDVYRILSFNITECATRLVSPYLGHTCSWLSRLPAVSVCTVYMSTPTAQVEGARHLLHSFTKL